ncbi:MAG: hypothetical protein ABIP97_07470 [Chthoniobacterales bacterium]
MKTTFLSIRFLCFLLGALLFARTESIATPLVVSRDPTRIELAVQREAKDKIEGGDWDDKIERVRLEVTVTNKTLNGPPLEGYQLQCWAIAKQIKDPKAYEVVVAETVPIRLTSEAQGRQIVHKTEEVKWGWDDTGAIWGKKYQGWIVLVLNAKGEMVACKSSNPMWEQTIAAKADGLKLNQDYTSKLDPSTSAPGRR